MGIHELKIINGKPERVCSECSSTNIKYDEDCCATWCRNCNDWAGGEIDRLIRLNPTPPPHLNETAEREAEYNERNEMAARFTRISQRGELG